MHCPNVAVVLFLLLALSACGGPESTEFEAQGSPAASVMPPAAAVVTSPSSGEVTSTAPTIAWGATGSFTSFVVALSDRSDFSYYWSKVVSGTARSAVYSNGWTRTAGAPPAPTALVSGRTYYVRVEVMGPSWVSVSKAVPFTPRATISGTYCQPTIVRYSSPPPGTNAVATYGLHAVADTPLSSSYRFHVTPATYRTVEGNSISSIRTDVYNASGQLICALGGGPMFRSSEHLPSKGLNVPQRISFNLRSSGYFSTSVSRAGPHVPLVMLGDMGSVGSEGIGPIFGNVSNFPISGRCGPANGGANNNYSTVESFRNSSVCLFGAEASSALSAPLSDQSYRVEATATPLMSGGFIRNQLSYRVTDQAGRLIANTTLLDDPQSTPAHGGWLLFAVIGGVDPNLFGGGTGAFDLWVDNLSVTYGGAPCLYRKFSAVVPAYVAFAEGHCNSSPWTGKVYCEYSSLAATRGAGWGTCQCYQDLPGNLDSAGTCQPPL